MLVQEAANELIEMLLDVGEEEIPEKGMSTIFVLHLVMPSIQPYVYGINPSGAFLNKSTTETLEWNTLIHDMTRIFGNDRNLAIHSCIELFLLKFGWF